MGRFTKDAVQVAEVERQQPSRAAEVGADVIVPLMQSGITGVVGSGLLTWALAEFVPDYDGSLSRFFGFWALFLSAFVWVVLLVDTRSLLRTVERLVGKDLDGDGQVGERVVVVGARQNQQEALDRERQARSSAFAEFVSSLPTHGTGYQTWEGRLGRDMYLEFRDALLKLGYAKWNSPQDHRQGWSLVVPVQHVLRRVTDAD